MRKELSGVFIAILLVCLTLIACGGGGGGGVVGGSGSQATEPQATAATMIANTADAADHININLAYNSSDEALAVWMKYNGSQNILAYAFHNGTDWESENIIKLFNTYETDVVSNGTSFMAFGGPNDFYSWEFDPATKTLSSEITMPPLYGHMFDAASDGTSYMAVGGAHNGTSYELHATAFNGTGWEPAVRLDSSNYSVSDPVIISNGTGYLAAWRQESVSPGTYDILGNMYMNGSWGGAFLLDSGTKDAFHVSLATDGTGYAAAWEQAPDGDTDSAQWARLFDGLSWGSVEKVSEAAHSGYNPRLAYDGSNYAVTWWEYVPNNVVKASIYNGTGWPAPDTISDNFLSKGYVSMASDGNSFMAVWTEFNFGIFNSLASRYNGSTWSAPEFIETGDGDVEDQEVTANPSGGYGAYWYQESGGSHQPIVNRYSGSSWGGETDISETITKGSTGNKHSIATNLDGTTVAAWSQFIGLNKRGTYARINEAGAWGNPVLMGSSWFNTDPSVATNGDIFMLAYAEAHNDLGARIYNGTDWEDVDILDNLSGSVYASAVASDGENFAVVWRQSDSGYHIYANVYNGSGWNGTVRIDSETSSADTPYIASNGSNYAVAWNQQDSGGIPRIYASIYNGSGWDTPDVLPVIDENAYNPSISSNGSGYAVAWEQWGGSRYDAVVSTYESGTWGAPVSVDESDTASAYMPSIASNGTGYAVSWYIREGSYQEIYTSIYEGSAWGSQASISNAAVDSWSPQIASDGSEYAAIWYQYDIPSEGFAYAAAYNGTGWDSAIKLENVPGYADSVRITSNGAGYSGSWLKYVYPVTEIDYVEPWAMINIFNQ